MILELLILFSFFVEVGVLFYLEYKAWKTVYTPLNYLMLPFVFILLVTIVCSGNTTIGLMEFYYPSILIWSVGLLIFAVPSYVAGYFCSKIDIKCFNSIETIKIPDFLFCVVLVVELFFFIRFRHLSVSVKDFVGSEEFADQFAAQGLWGHLRQFLIPFLMMAIYFVDREHKKMWLIIIPVFFLCIINQVKGTIVISILAGLSMRLYSGKSRLSWRLFLWIVIAGFCVFLISYALLPILGKGEGKMTNELWLFVVRTFVHYITSGLQGLSIDMMNGFPDMGEFQIVLSPFVNIINMISGNNDLLISPVNAHYFYSGISLTNVRTFFGTLYIYSDALSFSLYILVLSSSLYALKIIVSRLGNVYLYTIYFFYLTLLAMGWFEFYFFHLMVIEIPVILLLIMLAVYFTDNYLLIRHDGVEEELSI